MNVNKFIEYIQCQDNYHSSVMINIIHNSHIHAYTNSESIKTCKFTRKMVKDIPQNHKFWMCKDCGNFYEVLPAITIKITVYCLQYKMEILY